MAASSTNGVQPVAFDTVEQVDDQLERILARIEQHVQQVSMGKDKAFAEQVRAMLRQNVLGPLADIVHDNVQINGMSWEDNASHAARATQPVNAGLLKNTIETQDAAFQLSSGNAVKRSTKISQLAMQVDARVSRVVHSGEEKTKVLEDQRTRREASVKVEGKDVDIDKTVQSDIHSAEEALSGARLQIGSVREKSERAASLAADVDLLQTR